MKQNIVWGLLDHTDGKMKGYFRIQRNGRRIADLFPYATDTDPSFIREQGQHIVDAMNDVERNQEQPETDLTETEIQ